MEQGQQIAHNIDKIAEGVFVLNQGDLSPMAIGELLRKNVKVLIVVSGEATNTGLERLASIPDLTVLIADTPNLTIEGLKSVSEMGNIRAWGVAISGLVDGSISTGSLAKLNLERFRGLVLGPWVGSVSPLDLQAIFEKANLQLFLDLREMIEWEGVRDLVA